LTAVHLLAAVVSRVLSLRDDLVKTGVGRFASLRRTTDPNAPWEIVSTGGPGYVRGSRDAWISGDPDTEFDAVRVAAEMLAGVVVSEAPAITEPTEAAK
jgi:hypothetical protein